MLSAMLCSMVIAMIFAIMVSQRGVDDGRLVMDNEGGGKARKSKCALTVTLYSLSRCSKVDGEG